MSPALAGRVITTEPPGKPTYPAFLVFKPSLLSDDTCWEDVLSIAVFIRHPSNHCFFGFFLLDLLVLVHILVTN